MPFLVSILSPLFLLSYEVLGFSCLSRFGGGSLPRDLSSLMNPRKGLDIQLAQLFLIERRWATTSKLLTCQSWNGSFRVVPLFIQNVPSLTTQCSPSWIHLVPRCHITSLSESAQNYLSFWWQKCDFFSLLNSSVFRRIKQSSAKPKTRCKERSGAWCGHIIMYHSAEPPNCGTTRMTGRVAYEGRDPFTAIRHMP